MTTVPRLECMKCGHIWIPRSDKLPDVCPKCKRYEWNVPEEDIKEDEDAVKAKSVDSEHNK